MTDASPHDEAPALVAAAPSGRYSTKAVVGLILAAVSVLFLLVPIVNWAIAIPAVILSHLALREITTTAERGRQVATAGLVIGYFSIGLTLVLLLVASAGIGAATAPAGQNHDACISRTDPSDAQVQKCIDSYNQ